MSNQLCFKSFPASLKAAEDEPGVFEAVVAVFGNVDRGGDRIVKGAFARTLKDRGLPPVLWGHDFSRPPIGAVEEAKETDEGLYVRARLFVDSSERAAEVNAGMKAGVVREFSFAYEVQDAAEITEDGATVNELKDLDLWEVSPVVVGMNPATRLVRPPKAAPTDGAPVDEPAGGEEPPAAEKRLPEMDGDLFAALAFIRPEGN